MAKKRRDFYNLFSKSQIQEIIGIAVNGVTTATRHLRMITLPHGRVYYHGFFVTKSMAAKRRRKCMKMVKNALNGIIY